MPPRSLQFGSPAPAPINFGMNNTTPKTLQKPLFTPLDVLKEIPKQFAEQVGAPQLRAYAGLAGAITGKTLTPETQFQKELYGTDKPITLSSVGKESTMRDPNVPSKGLFTKIDPAIGFAVGALDLIPGGSEAKAGTKAVVSTSPEVFTGLKNLTTRVLDRIVGRSTISKQLVQDLSKMSDITKPEKEAVDAALSVQPETGKFSAVKFANDVVQQLLPLKVRESSHPIFSSAKYESIVLPPKIRGTVADYGERIYESPIPTSAGDVHFSSRVDRLTGDKKAPGYFGHTRVEDMAPVSKKSGINLVGTPESIKRQGFETTGNIRRIIEIQSDLYQKGRLEKEAKVYRTMLSNEDSKRQEYLLGRRLSIESPNNIQGIKPFDDELKNINSELNVLKDKEDALRSLAETERTNTIAPLTQYNDPTAHFRMLREELKQAAVDGKTKVQIPTGETAMRVEGLGETSRWLNGDPGEFGFDTDSLPPLKKEDLKVGNTATQFDENGEGQPWIITDVLEDGKFKAAPKDIYDRLTRKELASDDPFNETFDISGNIDKSSPIYRFYEKTLADYARKNFGAKLITDPQGQTWFEIDIKPDMAGPVRAFSAVPPGALGAELSRRAQEKINKDMEEESKNPPIFIRKKKLFTPHNYLEETKDLSSDNITKGIIANESRGHPDPYSAVGRLTGDLGKYQVHPDTLKEWSKPFLGKILSKKEFLKNPEAQETFYRKFRELIDPLNLTDEEAIVAWHRGWGKLNSTDPSDTQKSTFRNNLKKKMSEASSTSYLKTAREAINNNQ